MPVEIDQRVCSAYCNILHLVELGIRTCSVDCLAVYLEPFSEVEQSFLLNHRDDAVSSRADVERHASAGSDGLDEMTYQFLRGEIIGQRLIAVKSERTAYAAALRPRSVGLSDTSAVFRSSETILRAVTPTVVDDCLLAYCVIIPCDEFGSMPLLSRVTPFAIGEDDRRTIFCHQFLELRNHMIVDIISNRIIWIYVPSVHWVSPFWKRVIESHLQTFGAYCISEFADDVAFRTADDAVPFWRILTIPEAIAIVMF